MPAGYADFSESCCELSCSETCPCTYLVPALLSVAWIFTYLHHVKDLILCQLNETAKLTSPSLVQNQTQRQDRQAGILNCSSVVPGLRFFFLPHPPALFIHNLAAVVVVLCMPSLQSFPALP